MRQVLQLGLVLIGLGVLLLVLAFTVLPDLTLPYATLQDIPDTDIVARGTVSCGDQMGIALALHSPTHGYFMLWMTAKVWLLAPFGREEPSEGTLAEKIYWGRWELRDERTWFVHPRVFQFPSDPEQRSKMFCRFLFPEDV